MGILSFLTGSKGSGPVKISGRDQLDGPAVDVLEKKGSTDILTSKDLAALLAAGASSAGVAVGPDSAMRYVTVWACVRLLAESIAQMPIHLYRKLPDGSKQRISDIALAEILSFSPNSWQTAFEYIEFSVTALCLRSNHYAYINRVGSGQLAELLPLLPQNVRVLRDGYELSYRVYFDNGSSEVFPQEKIHHVHGLSLDGFVGASPIAYQRNAIGTGRTSFATGRCRPGPCRTRIRSPTRPISGCASRGGKPMALTTRAVWSSSRNGSILTRSR